MYNCGLILEGGGMRGVYTGGYRLLFGKRIGIFFRLRCFRRKYKRLELCRKAEKPWGQRFYMVQR